MFQEVYRLLVVCVHVYILPTWFLYSNDFLDNFLSLVSFLSSISCQFCMWQDFSIHMDVSGGDGDKFSSLLESCSINQLVNQPTHLHGHTLDLILSPSDLSVVHGVKVHVSFYIRSYFDYKCSVNLSRHAVQPGKKVPFHRYHCL